MIEEMFWGGRDSSWLPTPVVSLLLCNTVSSYSLMRLYPTMLHPVTCNVYLDTHQQPKQLSSLLFLPLSVHSTNIIDAIFTTIAFLPTTCSPIQLSTLDSSCNEIQFCFYCKSLFKLLLRQ